MTAKEPKKSATQKTTLLERLFEVFKEVAYIQKQEGQGLKYKFVAHDAVVAKLRPALIAHGIFLATSVDEVKSEAMEVTDRNGIAKTVFRSTCKVTICALSVDDPEDCIAVTSYGEGLDPQDKSTGKAISYAVKYGLLKLFMLETGDEEESRYNFGPRPTISEEQVAFLKDVISRAPNLTLDRFCRAFQVDRLEELPEDRFQEAHDALEKHLERAKPSKATSEPASEAPK